MLVLSRKKNQAVTLNDIRITIVDIRQGQVRLGIEAPKSVTVLRDELHYRPTAQPGRTFHRPPPSSQRSHRSHRSHRQRSAP